MRFDPIRKVFAIAMGFGWAATVLAAQGAPDSLSALPWVQVGIGSAIALWGGMTRTAERALEANRSRTNFVLWRELVTDLFVSSSAGFLVFMLGALQQWNVWGLGASLLVSGYAGTRFLGKYAAGWLAGGDGALKERRKP